MTYELGKWKLDDLFPAHDSPEIEQAFKTLDSKVSKFEHYREKLSPDMDVEEFMSAVEEQESATRLANRVGQFAGLFFSEDTQNQAAQTFQAKVQQFMAGLQNRTLFFSLWWKSLKEEETKRFMEVSGEYEYWLQQIRNFKPYTLSEPEEKVINIKDCLLYTSPSPRD